MWGANIWLFLLWVTGSPNYQPTVAAGAPCMVYYSRGGEVPASPAPVCWYDPTNQNVSVVDLP